MISKARKILSALLTVTIISSAAVLSVPYVSAASATDKRVAVGTSHALMIDNDGNVWSMGNNDYRQLGDGSTETGWKPNMVYHNSQSGRAVSVAAGGKHSMLLTETGTVLMWGYGSSEMLPQLESKAVAISAGQELCMAILQNGTAQIWSDKLPVRSIRDEYGVILDIRDISVGSNEMILLLGADDGIVYQLDTDDYTTAVPVRMETAVTVTPSPTQGPTPTPTAEPTSKGSSSDISDPLGDLTNKGSQDKRFFGSEDGEILTGAVMVAAGYNFGAALLSTGDVYTWGQATNGVLGQGTSDNVYYDLADKVGSGLPFITKISAGKEHVIAQSLSGTYYGWGNASQRRLDWKKGGIITVPVELDIGIPGMTDFDCGDNFNLAVGAEGNIFTWGRSETLSQLELLQTLFRVEQPYLAVDSVGDETMTVRWDPEEYFTGLMAGFVVVYKMPNGTVNKTLLLPLSMSQITLKGLQAETNYTVSVEAHAKSGFVGETAPLVIKTLKDDGVTPTPEPTFTVTPEPTAPMSSEPVSSEPQVSEDDPGKSDLSDLFGMLLVGLVFIVLIGAVIAVIYVWRRVDRTEKSGVKPVRILRDDAFDDLRDYSSPEDEDYVLVEEPEDDMPLTKGSSAAWQDVGDENLGDTAEHEIPVDDDGSGDGPSEIFDEYPVSEEKITDKKQKFEDDDDDFIIRRPGEPRK